MSLPEPRLQPYLSVRNAAAAIDFYVSVFGMKERYRLPMGDKIAHAELEMSGARLLIADEFSNEDFLSPTTRGGTTVSLLLYVEDTHGFVAKALAAGCTQEGKTEDQFFGERTAKLVDPFGHRWMIHQRLREVPSSDIVAGWNEMMG